MIDYGMLWNAVDWIFQKQRYQDYLLIALRKKGQFLRIRLFHLWQSYCCISPAVNVKMKPSPNCLINANLLPLWLLLPAEMSNALLEFLERCLFPNFANMYP